LEEGSLSSTNFDDPGERGDQADRHEFLTPREFRAWHGALRFTTSAIRAIDEALTAAHSISITEYDVLITLYNAQEHRLRMAELASSVVLTPSGLTHLVGRLERRGFVERVVDEADRRSYFAVLTPAGDQRLRDARITHNDVVRRQLTRRLSQSQLDHLGSAWATLDLI
jgi:DNA-binding MarR family transcriptional regulator